MRIDLRLMKRWKRTTLKLDVSFNVPIWRLVMGILCVHYGHQPLVYFLSLYL